ncbi:maleylpyruvate isomerase family mycothiol-dependent enzyme [Actinotalea sp.]|uniref:maleylpyruvate isomerase family mycothiol-dependent enzyme n=1 Tax=Actinotalea sp. TaxID=1872145 RepID=UPI0035648E67
MIPSDVVVAMDSIEWTHERVRTALEGLRDDQVRESSRLPGWTRGHVLAHLANVGEAAVRQWQNAYEDAPVVPFYDGGTEGRNRAIEEGATASAAEHVARVQSVMDRVEGLLDLLDDAAMARRTGFRDRTAAAIVLAWWRETSIHLTDLDLGVEHTMWGAALREHLVGYLGARVPEGIRLDLEPTDVDEPRYIGDGRTLTVTGAANDIVAWLAGREPLAPVRAKADGVEVPLPELGPWP